MAMKVNGATRPLLNRPVEQHRERLLVGSPEVCAKKLSAYKAAGVQRIFVWPIKDEIEQLCIFKQQVAPRVVHESSLLNCSKNPIADRVAFPMVAALAPAQ